MSFVVSSRKYRPQQFKAVKGQEHVTTTLKNALKNNQLAQVFLFCGPKGTGKTTCARILAKAINCSALQDTGEPCSNCKSCQDFQKQTSLNIHELDAASNNSVEDVRNLVEQVRYHTTSGKKVFIIDEAHMLSKAAFNALLKTLEEPPEHVVFILATTEKYKIIPTILSRCQVFDFHRITPQQIISQLQYIATQENIICEKEALRLISHKAEGALRDALSMFDLVVTFSENKKLTKEATLRHLHLLDHDYYFKVLHALSTAKVGEVLLLYDEIMRLGFSGQDFITGLSEHIRNLLICQVADTLPLFNLATTTQTAYKNQAKQINTLFLYKALDLTHTYGLHYKNSQSKRLHVELMLIKIAQLITTKESFVHEVAQKHSKKTTSTTAQSTHKQVTPSPTGYLPTKNATRVASPIKLANTQSTQLSNSDTSPQKTGQPSTTHTTKVATPRPQSLPKTAANTNIPPSTNKETTALKRTIKIPTNIANLQTAITQKSVKKIPIATQTTTSSTTHPLLLDYQQVLKHWKAYGEQLKKEGNALVYTLMQQDIEVKDNSIIIKLFSPVQQSILSELQPKLLPYLREQLNNNTLALKTAIQEKEKNTKPYTNAEKLHYLTKKYPPIALLQKELALDTL